MHRRDFLAATAACGLATMIPVAKATEKPAVWVPWVTTSMGARPFQVSRSNPEEQKTAVELLCSTISSHVDRRDKGYIKQKIREILKDVYYLDHASPGWVSMVVNFNYETDEVKAHFYHWATDTFIYVN